MSNPLAVAPRRRGMGIALLMVVFVGLIGFALASSREGGRHHESRSYEQSPGNWQVALVHRGVTELSDGKGSDLVPLAALFGAKEGMPAMLRRRIRVNLGGVTALKLRFAQAQHLASPDGSSFWIVEGKGVTCLFRDGLPASSCRTSASAREEGIWLGTYSTSETEPGRPVAFLALGIVPGASTSVKVRSEGSQITIPVRNHLWALKSRFPIKVDMQ